MKKQVQKDASVAQNSESGPSVAGDLRKLKSSVLTVLEKRGTVPNTFFWSLFHSQIEMIRKRKEKERLLRELLS